MFGPTVLAWMIKTNKTAGAAYEGARIGALGDIATQAGESEVGRRCWAELLAADDMIHMEAEMGVVLMGQAVFADPLSPFEDKAAQSPGDIVTHAAETGFRARALALARLMTWSR